MKKLFAIVLIVLFLAGCVAQPEIPTETTDPDKAQLISGRYPIPLDYETYQQITAPGYHDLVAYPWNYVTYDDIRSLGSFVYYMTENLLEGNSCYWYSLMDSNNFEFRLRILHMDLNHRQKETATLVPGARHMTQIEVDSESNQYLQIVSNGFTYHYSDGQLSSIEGKVNGICFEIYDVSSVFQEYPEDGERTLISLLLSVDSKDQWTAKWMLQRCFPKTWVHYTAYCVIAVVILLPVAVWIYKRKHRSLSRTSKAPASATPDEPNLLADMVEESE